MKNAEKKQKRVKASPYQRREPCPYFFGWEHQMFSNPIVHELRYSHHCSKHRNITCNIHCTRQYEKQNFTTSMWKLHISTTTKNLPHVGLGVPMLTFQKKTGLKWDFAHDVSKQAQTMQAKLQDAQLTVLFTLTRQWERYIHFVAQWVYGIGFS